MDATIHPNHLMEADCQGPCDIGVCGNHIAGKWYHMQLMWREFSAGWGASNQTDAATWENVLWSKVVKVRLHLGAMR